MAMTETLSTWQAAAQTGYGPGMPSDGQLGGGGVARDGLQSVHAALSSAPATAFDMEGTLEVGAISPRVRQWRADLDTSTPPARRNRWVEDR